MNTVNKGLNSLPAHGTHLANESNSRRRNCESANIVHLNIPTVLAYCHLREQKLLINCLQFKKCNHYS